MVPVQKSVTSHNRSDWSTGAQSKAIYRLLPNLIDRRPLAASNKHLFCILHNFEANLVNESASNEQRTYCLIDIEMIFHIEFSAFSASVLQSIDHKKKCSRCAFFFRSFTASLRSKHHQISTNAYRLSLLIFFRSLLWFPFR